jgi:hypothetical protein
MLIAAAVVDSRVPVGRWVAVLKKVITWAIVVFIVYYLATNPTGAADFVKGVFHWLEGAGHSLAQFVNSL